MRGGTSVDELLTMLRSKKRRLPSEIGAFVALQATEALLDRAYAVDATRVFIKDDGTVAVDSEERCDEAVALAGVRSILGALLVSAGDGVPPMMLALVDVPADVPQSLASFRDAIEAALVPLNRGAAERVLARSLRDIRRESAGGNRALEAADADFDALLDGRDAPDKADVVIVAPELGPDAPRETNRDRDKRSIFRDDDVGLDDTRDDDGNKTMLYLAFTALALAVLGVVVFFTR